MSDYEKLKVTELRSLLKERAIPATGLTRKAQYIQALIDADAVQSQEAEELVVDRNVDEVDSNEHIHDPAASEAQATTTQAGSLQEGNEHDTVETEESSKDVKETQIETHDAPTSTNMTTQEPEKLDTKDTPDRKRKREDDEEADEASETVKRLKEEDDSMVINKEEDFMVIDKRQDSSDMQMATSEQINVPGGVDLGSSEKDTYKDDAKADKMADEDDILPSADETMEIEMHDDKTRSTHAIAEQPGTNKAQADNNFASTERNMTAEYTVPSQQLRPLSTHTEDDRQQPHLPSEHPPTPAIYVRNLMRPLQAQAFRTELEAFLTTADSIEDLHLDNIKTHAFIVCSSISAAKDLRVALHDKPWPRHETQRKSLWVDFIPIESVQSWIEQETKASRDARFEVVYTNDSGKINASLQETGLRQPSKSGMGMPGAPSGPRGQRRLSTPATIPREQAQPKPQSSSFNKLDQYFRCTTAKPKVYWQPVDKTLVDRRLDELDRETARDWNGGRSWNRSSRLTPIDQLRRYTFEDSDRIVDGGVDFGGFGRSSGAGGGGGFPGGSRGGHHTGRRYRP